MKPVKAKKQAMKRVEVGMDKKAKRDESKLTKKPMKKDCK